LQFRLKRKTIRFASYIRLHGRQKCFSREDPIVDFFTGSQQWLNFILPTRN